MNTQNLKEKILYFLNIGYSIDEIIWITRKVPTVFNYSCEGLDEKIKVLKNADLQSEILSRPTCLMQGVELSYARVKFMKENNLVFDHKAFNYLFLSNKEFHKRFGITNEEIKEKYPYKK